MSDNFQFLDVVALTEDLPELELYRGQVGTIVDEYERGVFEVEWERLNRTGLRSRNFKC